jgi:peroxiredoxin
MFISEKMKNNFLKSNGMKNILIALCACLLVSCTAATQDGTFTLKGKIGNLDSPAKIYFSYWNVTEYVDSAFLDNGYFSFKGTVDGPAAARLILDYTGDGMNAAALADNVFYLYLEPGTVELQSADSLQNIVFHNSPVNKDYHDYLTAIGGQIQDLAARMNEKAAAASPEQLKDTAFFSALNREYAALLDERMEKQIQYASRHPNSFFSVVALSESATRNFDAEKIEPLFLSISEKYRETNDGKALASRINAAKTIVIGNEAPDFTQNDTIDNPVKLSDFRGKYVLIDFWASWCGPCRQENPNLVKAYSEYKDKGFEILGISLDRADAKQAWINAIKKDGLTWTQVSDLKYWNNEVAVQYGIRAVPQNYLIDPKGIIVAKNLRGKALSEYLEKLFP